MERKKYHWCDCDSIHHHVGHEQEDGTNECWCDKCGHEWIYYGPGWFMRKYPRVTAHIISESLGYATPTKAAIIGLDGMHGEKNYCEWVACCWNGDAKAVLRKSITSRHYHKGFMSEYKAAIMLVRHAIKTEQEPLLASWF